MRPGCVIACATIVAALAGCRDATEPLDDAEPFDGTDPFELFVQINNYTGGSVEIYVDDEPAPEYFTRSHDSYNEGRVTATVIETRRDGVVVDRCLLYGGACGTECEPARVTSSVCIEDSGEIFLNTWDCPCAGPIRDWFCGGPCESTAP